MVSLWKVGDGISARHHELGCMVTGDNPDAAMRALRAQCHKRIALSAIGELVAEEGLRSVLFAGVASEIDPYLKTAAVPCDAASVLDMAQRVSLLVGRGKYHQAQLELSRIIDALKDT